MKHILTRSLALALLLGVTTAARAQVAYLDHQHMDFRLAYDAGADGTNKLNLLLGYNNGTEIFTVSNSQVYIIGNTNAKKAIPANPNYAFLGPVGAPIWILPQSQDVTLPYLGVSAEDIPVGEFDNPMRLQLVSVEGPGNFFAWSVSGAGNPPTIKMIGTNGVASPDYNAMEPLLGSHEHNNWGFSTNGLYRITLRTVGSPTGTGTNFIGRDVAWAFQILPLRPWESWVSTNWLPATATTIAGPNADPDGDGIPNALEYALNLNPNVASSNGLPTCSTFTTNAQTYSALTFTRVKTATDLTYQPSATGDLTSGTWTPLTNIVSLIDKGATEAVTVSDFIPVAGNTTRFYQLRVQLPYP